MKYLLIIEFENLCWQTKKLFLVSIVGKNDFDQKFSILPFCLNNIGVGRLLSGRIYWRRRFGKFARRNYRRKKRRRVRPEILKSGFKLWNGVKTRSQLTQGRNVWAWNGDGCPASNVSGCFCFCPGNCGNIGCLAWLIYYLSLCLLKFRR